MPLRHFALLCFFLSGATGLLYQVLWTRLLGTTIGNTHFSITVVVSVFMGGLALGSFLGGRLADRSRRPLRLYGILNLSGALLCLAVPWVSTWGRPLFRMLYESHDGQPEATPLLVARLAFSTLLILGPTTAMGATLPVLARYFTSRLDEVGFAVGRLYAVNTFGAVVGVYFAGFWAMEHLGVTGTTALAVGIDVVIGLLVIWLARNEEAPIVEPRSSAPRSSEPDRPEASVEDVQVTVDLEAHALLRAARRAAIAFAVTGFANMLLQVAWTKTIVGAIGNSTYAFSLIVTLFILGIGLGGAFMTFLVDRVRHHTLWLAGVIIATGLSLFATVPLFGSLPIWVARAYDEAFVPGVYEGNYETFLDIKLRFVALLLLPSTTLMGMVFPLVSKLVTQSVERVGRSIGSAYFLNTLGSILGTLASGFIFVPLFDRIYGTLYLGAALSLATGLWLLSGARSLKPGLRLALVGLIGGLTLLGTYLTRPYGVLGETVSHRWDPTISAKGAYVYWKGSYWKDRRQQEVLPVEELVASIRRGQTMEWYREGIHAPVAVVTNPKKGRAMRISGKVEASVPAKGGISKDMPHQILAGHLPMILHPDPKKVLTLGLGGGVTLGTLTLYPIDRVDSLEISPEVIEAARLHFADVNRGALGDTPLRPVRNIVGDGRNHLLYTVSRYDVITSVPSNPWIAGIGTLFTEEFFEICKSRLKPGGVISNWIHKINMRPADLRTVFRTFQKVFGENAQLWDLGYDVLLIAGNDAPVRFDPERFEKLLAHEGIRGDLALLGIEDRGSFLRHFRFDATKLASYADGGPINTDALPVLEFSCPRGLYGLPLEAYRHLAEAGVTPFPAALLAPGSTLDLDEVHHRQENFNDYLVLTEIVNRFVRVISRAQNAGSDDSFGVDPSMRERIAVEVAPEERRMLEENSERVVRLLVKLDSALGKHADDWLEKRILAQADLAYRNGGKTIPEILGRYYYSIAQQQAEGLARGNLAEPAKVRALRLASLERAHDFLPRNDGLVRELAKAYLEDQAFSRARTRFSRSVDLHPEHAPTLHALAIMESAGGNFERALPLFERAFARTTAAKERSTIRTDIAFGHQLADRIPRAVAELERALAIDPENALARERLAALKQRSP